VSLDEPRHKVLVLTGHSPANSPAIESLRSRCDVVEALTIDQAIELLRRDHFTAVFSDSADFLPLERALVSQQANLILNTIGEGVCIVDGEGRCSWMNKKMGAWPARVHEKIRRTCQEAFDLFSHQVSPQNADTPASFSRSKRYTLNIEDQQYMEMIASPVINPAGAVVQVVAVVWDATGTRRLQQKIDAIDKAGRELVRLESDAIVKMNVGQRLKLLEDKIISFTRELMHFDHFAIRLLDRKSNKLEMVISAGLPPEAVNIELSADGEGNGISGFVAATGRSYICPDVERDPRYVMGLDQAKSSLTVPLRLHDKVIGIFNIESRQRAAFNEDDRQFAEIFGRYVAIALNILDLMVVERVSTSHKVADEVNSEVAGPLNDITLDATTLIDEYIGHDDLRQKLQQILENVTLIRKSLRQAAEGTNTKILGAAEVKGEQDTIIANARILVADDEPNIRTTISDVLRKYHAAVTMVTNGSEAIAQLEQGDFDLVISDIKMPDKSGYDVFAAARKHSQTVPVILMTGFGYDPNHSIVRASQEGLQAVMFKPFKVDQLLTEVRKALQPQPAVRT
ncbi:MAG TPA: response regulator, partial [Tepidisphaeraceae bacterium]|nr:response regulator [Tepidisphaeraceae bacterium]